MHWFSIPAVQLEFTLGLDMPCQRDVPPNPAHDDFPIFKYASLPCPLFDGIDVARAVDAYRYRNEAFILASLSRYEAQSCVREGEQITASSHAKDIFPLP